MAGSGFSSNDDNNNSKSRGCDGTRAYYLLHCRILPNSVKFCQVLPNSATLPYSVNSATLPYSANSATLPYSAKLYQILPHCRIL